jgi:nucleoside-diphosphate-sugar epimerase
MKVLITGARGFAGHALLQHLIENTDWIFECPRRVSKKLDRLDEIWSDRIKDKLESYDYIFHAAGNASSIDCINNPIKAVDDNILETLRVLEIARQHNLKRFVFFSSVEIYSASNMYAATKIACEEICKAYSKSYNIPISIVRINNTFGPRCQPERFPVVALKNIINCKPFIFHCDENGNIIKRRWLPIADVASQILFITKQEPGGIYNLTGNVLMSNLEFASKIALFLGREISNYTVKSECINGRDTNQDVSPELIYNLGWRQEKTFDERIEEFISFSIQNPRWLDN